MTDRVIHDVNDVLVGERVSGLTPLSFPDDEPCRAQHPQMLRDERLRNPECLDELMDATRPIPELAHDEDPNRPHYSCIYQHIDIDTHPFP